ncbi:hypothetical protein ACFU7X_02355 [Streptomyces chartreusis]|uniref:hypothetical protein n=1 Tax=Streptomyces chartreusis TaxID=1969 RepID=UPI00369DAE75
MVIVTDTELIARAVLAHLRAAGSGEPDLARSRVVTGPTGTRYAALANSFGVPLVVYRFDPSGGQLRALKGVPEPVRSAYAAPGTAAA